MAPSIQRIAEKTFRQLDTEAREDLVAEVLANAFVAFDRLFRSGRESLAYPTPLAYYAIRQVRDGRRVGNRSNKDDVLSSYGQQRNGANIERLDVHDAEQAEWRAIVVEDRRAGPAETAAARIDVEAWLKSLPQIRRNAAFLLALGETTGAVARILRVSPARISQLRHELHEAWLRFHGEDFESVRSQVAA